MLKKTSASYEWDDQGAPVTSRILTMQESVFIRSFLRGLPAGLALDVGCGTGKNLRLLRELGHTCIGLEYIVAPLQLLQKRQNIFFLVQADALALPFAPDTFNIVLGIQMQHYFQNIHNFYAEIYRVLTPGGFAIITMTNRHSHKGILYETYLKMTGRKRTTCAYQYDLRYFLQAALDVGLQAYQMYGYGWNFLPRKCNFHWLAFLFYFLEKALHLKNLPFISPYACVLLRKPL